MAADGLAKPRSPEELRAEIERTRREIQSSVNALRTRVEVAADWRAWYRRNPGVFIGAAVAVGFWLAVRD